MKYRIKRAYNSVANRPLYTIQWKLCPGIWPNTNSSFYTLEGAIRYIKEEQTCVLKERQNRKTRYYYPPFS